ncbi:MAG: hypothetical protein ACK4YP_17345 [Myxococcota bacterium]
MLPLLLALACAPKPAAPEAPAADAPAAPEAPAAEVPAAPAPEGETVSPPVTLEEFRAAFPAGTTIRLGVQVAGQPPLEERWEWTAVDAEGGTMRSTTLGPDGSVLQEAEARVLWTDLMGHARFPADRTVVTDSRVTVPAGTFETWLYTVTGDDPTEIRRYHFAREMPGPPVLFTIETAGTEVFRMEVLERTPMPAGK